MTIWLIVLIALAWSITGTTFLCLDWIDEFDLNLGNFIFHLLIGTIIGPVAIIIWYKSDTIILIKKRRK